MVCYGNQFCLARQLHICTNRFRDLVEQERINCIFGKGDIVSGRWPSNVAGARETQEASSPLGSAKKPAPRNLSGTQTARKMPFTDQGKPALQGKHRRDATGASGAKKEREGWGTPLESVDKAYQEAVQTMGI
jgi:hypothetical protein